MGPLAVAGLGLAGGLVEAGVSSAFNAWQAGKNRDFQKNMSDTAHQREVADLKAAGLNPILSATKGGPGASTPSGSSASAAHSDGTGRGIAAMAAQSQLAVNAAVARDHNSAADLKITEKEDMLLTRLSRIDVLLAEAALKYQGSYHSIIDQKKIGEEIANLQKQRELVQLEVSHSALSLDHSRRESEFHKGIGGKIAPWMKLNPLGQTGINFLRLKTPSGRR